MQTPKRTLLFLSALALGCAAETTGKFTSDKKPDAPETGSKKDKGQGKPGASPDSKEPEPVDVAPRPAAGPEHLAAFRIHLNRGHLGKALRQAGSVLDEHPDDPWVMADVGFAKAATRRSTREEGQQLLAKALELADSPELRAQVLYYQARLKQYEEGMPISRDAVANAFAESPYAVVQRNLELIDAVPPPGLEVVRDETTKAFCEGVLTDARHSTKNRTCVVVKVGETLWARDTWFRLDGAGEIAVFHDWRLVDPKPKNPERLRSNFGDPNDPISDIAVCSGEEMITVAQAYGGEGAVLSAKVMDHRGESYIVVECREDHYNSNFEGEYWTQEPSLYTMVCSLERGWCDDAIYGREVLGDGTSKTATVEVEPGKIIVTKSGEQPISYAFP